MWGMVTILTPNTLAVLCQKDPVLREKAKSTIIALSAKQGSQSYWYHFYDFGQSEHLDEYLFWNDAAGI